MANRVIHVLSPNQITDTQGEVGPVPTRPHLPAVVQTSSPKKRLPLGDYTEKMLSSVGVTPDNYTAAKAALGMAPTCNCAKRKDWLNRAGEWLASLRD